MTVRSVVLSGLSLVTPRALDRLGLVAGDVDTDSTCLHIFLDGEAEGRNFFTADLGKKNGNWSMNLEQIEKLFETLQATGPIYTSVDTYLYLIQKQHIAPDKIAGVFPWPAEQPCKVLPRITPSTDAICRNVALYFWNLHHHEMIDWCGVRRTFPHRASNTLTFRARAPYHNVERSMRATIKPVPEGNATLQFDWSAAEFNLILQHLGYQPGEDAYGEFVSQGMDRNQTKTTVLAHIYGALDKTLYERAGGEVDAVDKIMSHLETAYPKVGEWREKCINNRIAEFNGFQYDLGDIPYKRPNHWAQTALQLCKWELMSRLTCAGIYQLGCGDLHDQLYFDVDPSKPEPVAELISQIRAPIFGRYNLRPQFKPIARAWG